MEIYLKDNQIATRRPYWLSLTDRQKVKKITDTSSIFFMVISHERKFPSIDSHSVNGKFPFQRIDD